MGLGWHRRSFLLYSLNFLSVFLWWILLTAFFVQLFLLFLAYVPEVYNFLFLGALSSGSAPATTESVYSNNNSTIDVQLIRNAKLQHLWFADKESLHRGTWIASTARVLAETVSDFPQVLDNATQQHSSNMSSSSAPVIGRSPSGPLSSAFTASIARLDAKVAQWYTAPACTPPPWAVKALRRLGRLINYVRDHCWLCHYNRKGIFSDFAWLSNALDDEVFASFNLSQRPLFDLHEDLFSVHVLLDPDFSQLRLLAMRKNNRDILQSPTRSSLIFQNYQGTHLLHTLLNATVDVLTSKWTSSQRSSSGFITNLHVSKSIVSDPATVALSGTVEDPPVKNVVPQVDIVTKIIRGIRNNVFCFLPSNPSSAIKPLRTTETSGHSLSGSGQQPSVRRKAYPSGTVAQQWNKEVQATLPLKAAWTFPAVLQDLDLKTGVNAMAIEQSHEETIYWELLLLLPPNACPDAMDFQFARFRFSGNARVTALAVSLEGIFYARLGDRFVFRKSVRLHELCAYATNDTWGTGPSMVLPMDDKHRFVRKQETEWILTNGILVLPHSTSIKVMVSSLVKWQTSLQEETPSVTRWIVDIYSIETSSWPTFFSENTCLLHPDMCIFRNQLITEKYCVPQSDPAYPLLSLVVPPTLQPGVLESVNRYLSVDGIPIASESDALASFLTGHFPRVVVPPLQITSSAGGCGAQDILETHVLLANAKGVTATLGIRCSLRSCEAAPLRLGLVSPDSAIDSSILLNRTFPVIFRSHTGTAGVVASRAFVTSPRPPSRLHQAAECVSTENNGGSSRQSGRIVAPLDTPAFLPHSARHFVLPKRLFRTLRPTGVTGGSLVTMIRLDRSSIVSYAQRRFHTLRNILAFSNVSASWMAEQVISRESFFVLAVSNRGQLSILEVLPQRKKDARWMVLQGKKLARLASPLKGYWDQCSMEGQLLIAEVALCAVILMVDRLVRHFWK